MLSCIEPCLSRLNGNSQTDDDETKEDGLSNHGSDEGEEEEKVVQDYTVEPGEEENAM